MVTARRMCVHVEFLFDHTPIGTHTHTHKKNIESVNLESRLNFIRLTYREHTVHIKNSSNMYTHKHSPFLHDFHIEYQRKKKNESRSWLVLTPHAAESTQTQWTDFSLFTCRPPDLKLKSH